MSLLFVHLRSYASIRNLICSCCKKTGTNVEEDLDGTKEFRDQTSHSSNQSEKLGRATTAAVAIKVADMQILDEDDYLSDSSSKERASNHEEAPPRVTEREGEEKDERSSLKQKHTKRNTCHIERASESEDEMSFTYQFEQMKTQIDAKQRVVSGQINQSIERTSYDCLIDDN